MKIRKIELKNFRCFEHKTFEFSDQFNVLIGDNATGKTAILDALAIGAGSFFLGIDNIDSRNILRDEIRYVTRKEGETPTIQGIPPVIISCEGCFEDVEYISWTREKRSENGRTNREGAKSITGYAMNLQARVRIQEKDRDKIILPLISYYGTGRLWVQRKETRVETIKPGSRFRGYENCLTNSYDIKQLIRWFKTFELGSRQREKTIGVLSAVKEAVKNCMEDWQEVKYDVLADELLATSNDERTLPFRMLSDGVRNMIGMVADIAYRCVTLNPQFEANAARLTPGIVLIDEIELHLHPQWQARAIEDIRRTFPNIQFIVTTHSPFIIQSLHNGKLINLNSSPPSEYEGRSIEDIIEDIMGIDLPQYSRRKLAMFRAAEEYYRVLEDAENIEPDHQKEIDKLKQKLDELSMPFSDDPAYHAFLKMERLARGI
jgi:predicted ATP-binding protein involved in virulence